MPRDSVPSIVCSYDNRIHPAGLCRKQQFEGSPIRNLRPSICQFAQPRNRLRRGHISVQGSADAAELTGLCVAHFFAARNINRCRARMGQCYLRKAQQDCRQKTDREGFKLHAYISLRTPDCQARCICCPARSMTLSNLATGCAIVRIRPRSAEGYAPHHGYNAR